MSNPIRMCIVCKVRSDKNILLRFQCIDNVLTSFSGQGRSFYLCNSCAQAENKKQIERTKKVINKIFRRGKEAVNTTILEGAI